MERSRHRQWIPIPCSGQLILAFGYVDFGEIDFQGTCRSGPNLDGDGMAARDRRQPPVPRTLQVLYSGALVDLQRERRLRPERQVRSASQGHNGLLQFWHAICPKVGGAGLGLRRLVLRAKRHAFLIGGLRERRAKFRIWEYGGLEVLKQGSAAHRKSDRVAEEHPRHRSRQPARLLHLSARFGEWVVGARGWQQRLQ